MLVQVCYATLTQQWSKTVELSNSATIKQAIEQSGVLQDCPEIDLSKQKVGVWGKIAALEDVVNEGDRIEIYRPLLIDPKQARMLRAQRAKEKALAAKRAADNRRR